MSDLILGLTWDQIRRAQQGDNSALHDQIVKHDTPQEMKAKLESEIARFGSHIYKEVAEKYGVEIPSNYILDGDKYKPASEVLA